LKLPYTVGFKYQPEGIRVRGQWFPILKMEWVQGENLLSYVQTRLGQPALRQLAEKLVTMSLRLAEAGVAHGDLQHGNVLIVGGEPRLIDYDGMFVPALAGWRSHEVGHPNFQHPCRTDMDFGPTADHFSVWVIYLSLLALSSDAHLWSRYRGGDECLLFRRGISSNPVSPNSSTIWHDRGTHWSRPSPARSGRWSVLPPATSRRSTNPERVRRERERSQRQGAADSPVSRSGWMTQRLRSVIQTTLPSAPTRRVKPSISVG